MLAHDVAAPNRVEPDMPPLARAGDAVAGAVADRLQRHAAPLGRGLAQHQRRARGRIDLVPVMRLDHLDIVFLVQRGGDLFGQLHQQVDAQAHIARAHHHRVTRGGLDAGQVILGQPGGADHMHRPGLRRDAREFHCCGGRGKIDYRLRARKRLQRVVGHVQVHRRATHRHAHILPDPIMAFALDHAHQLGLVAVQHRADQHLPHAPRGARYHDSRQVGHLRRSSFFRAVIPKRPPLAKPRQTLKCWVMAKNKFHDGPGPSQRQLRVGELIRRTLSEVLARGDIHDPDLNRLSITVGEVTTSPDLRIATAYVLPLGGTGQDDVLKLLSRNKGELRRVIGKKVGLKFTPDLRFRIDETFDRLDETRRLFSQDDVRRDVEADERDDDA